MWAPLNRSIRVLTNRLLRLDNDRLASVLAQVANEGNISTGKFKRARTDLPFPDAKWSKYAPQFGLTPRADNLNENSCDTFKTPSYRLPPSFHEAIFENAWLWQEVYQKRPFERREEASLRALDPYIVPIMALFQGRVRDLPEHTMLPTKYSTPEVDHEISMSGGALLIIKFDKFVSHGETEARLFLDLVSTAERNRSIDFAGLRVYGILTDLEQFSFYSYQPVTNQFYFDETVFVDSDSSHRIRKLSDMMNVTNKIFGVVLSAYMDGLRASIAKIKDKVDNNASELAAGGETIVDCKPTALKLAERCRTKFEEPIASFRAIEEKGNAALRLLTRSVLSIRRAEQFPDQPRDHDRITKATEVKKLATRVTRDTHKRLLSKPNH